MCVVVHLYNTLLIKQNWVIILTLRFSIFPLTNLSVEVSSVGTPLVVSTQHTREFEEVLLVSGSTANSLSYSYFLRLRCSFGDLTTLITTLASFMRENIMSMGFLRLRVTLEAKEESKIVTTCFLVVVWSQRGKQDSKEHIPPSKWKTCYKQFDQGTQSFHVGEEWGKHSI